MKKIPKKERIEYFNKEYSAFWKRRTKIYGVGGYTKGIIQIFKKTGAQSAFEVGIGTGWPFACALVKNNNIQMAGCDISDRLIKSVRNAYPDIEVYPCELEDIPVDKITKRFELVYCVRTSWFIYDFNKTIELMVTMLDNHKKDAYLVFDIMDKRCLCSLLNRYYRYPKLKIKYYYNKYIKKTEDGMFPVLNYYNSVHAVRKVLDKYPNITYKMYHENTLSREKNLWNSPKRLFVAKLKKEF